jgi:hypothetical protein
MTPPCTHRKVWRPDLFPGNMGKERLWPLDVDSSEFKSQFYYLPDVWFGVHHLTSLTFGLLICNIGIMIFNFAKCVWGWNETILSQFPKARKVRVMMSKRSIMLALKSDCQSFAFMYLFCGTRIWTQGFTLIREVPYYLSYPTSPLCVWVCVCMCWLFLR